MGYIALTQFGLASTAPGSGFGRAVHRTDENLFSGQLERRIRDYRQGRTDRMDRAVDIEIAARNAGVNAALASSDPKALQSYGSLLTGLTYSRSARVVANVEHTIRSLSRIPSEEEAQAQTDKLVAAYEARQEVDEQGSAAPDASPVTPLRAKAVAAYQNSYDSPDRTTA